MQVKTKKQGAGKPKPAPSGGVQAGTRRQPAKLPAQSLKKPGNEHELQLQSRYLVPDYRGSGKLQGMRALVTGGDLGIGRAVALLFAREGADVAVLYLDEHEDAEATCKAVEDEGGRCIAISGDVRDPAFCNAAAARVNEVLGGIWKVLYANSLSLAYALLFLLSFAGHACGSWLHENEQRIMQGRAAISLFEHLCSARFWFESMQNWQSEFLAVLSIVVLSIWLRQDKSPQSKPLQAPASQTGT